MNVTRSAVFRLEEPAATIEHHGKTMRIHEVTLATARIAVGHVTRAASDRDRLDFLDNALRGSHNLCREDAEKAKSFYSAGQHARAEELILGHVLVSLAARILALGTLAGNNGEDVASTHGLETSITHGHDAVFAVAARVPAGIDYETIKPRDIAWEKKMDPHGDAMLIQASFPADGAIDRAIAATITWCCKEAGVKATKNDLRAVPSTRIEARGTHLEVTVPGEKGPLRAWWTRHLSGIIAIALGQPDHSP